MPGQTAKQWLLQHKPERSVSIGDGPDATFKLRETELPEPKEGEALVELIYLGNDPAQRGWMDKHADPQRLYRPPLKEGEVVATVATVSRVVRTGGNSKLKAGQFVDSPMTGWSTFAVLPEKALRPVEPIDHHPLSVHIGALGGSVALTAYFALVDTLKLKEGESIIVNGAAGGVGSVAVQYAKHTLKAKLVVGVAGTKEKCEWIKKLGCDVAICYKDQDWKEQLAKATPDFVECALDNVGGQQLSAILTRMKRFGRIAAIGAIDSYNGESREDGQPKPDVANWFEVVANRIMIRGSIVTDYMSRFGEARDAFLKAYKDGQLQLEGSETVVEGRFEDVPRIWNGLFSGQNQGKFVTKLQEP